MSFSSQPIPLIASKASSIRRNSGKRSPAFRLLDVLQLAANSPYRKQGFFHPPEFGQKIARLSAATITDGSFKNGQEVSAGCANGLTRSPQLVKKGCKPRKQRVGFRYREVAPVGHVMPQWHEPGISSPVWLWEVRNELPQPQELTAFGFSILNPPPIRLSTQSMLAPLI
jgi:hypothetical protein